MKKWFVLILAAMLLLSAIPALADISDDIAAAEAMTHEELVEKITYLRDEKFEVQKAMFGK